MHEGRRNYPKFQIHEKTLSTSEVFCRSEKLCGARKSDQSLFNLLLEIESRLGTKGRNDQMSSLGDPKKKIASVRESIISPVNAGSRDYSGRKQNACAILNVAEGSLSLCDQYDSQYSRKSGIRIWPKASHLNAK
jgi:hypothetical protein